MIINFEKMSACISKFQSFFYVFLKKIYLHQNWTWIDHVILFLLFLVQLHQGVLMSTRDTYTMTSTHISQFGTAYWVISNVLSISVYWTKLSCLLVRFSYFLFRFYLFGSSDSCDMNTPFYLVPTRYYLVPTRYYFVSTR